VTAVAKAADKESEWRWLPLEDCCTFHNGLWTGKKPPFQTANVIRNTNFTADGTIDLSDVAVLEVEARQLARRRLQKGDIIIEKSGGGPKQPVGRVVLFDIDDGVYSFSNFTSAIRVKDQRQLDPRYLHRVLYWWYVDGRTEPLQRRSTGIRNLDFSAYQRLKIPLPPLEEQNRIVAVLDQAFAALDRARALAEANLADAEELFDGWLTAVFHDHPAEWSTRKLRDLCHQITVGHVGPMADRYASAGTPFLRSQNVRPFRIDLSDVKFIDDAFRSELKKSELRPGDVAIVRTGYPGTAAVIPDDLPLANCADLVIARPKDEVHPEFLAMFLNSSFGKRMVADKSVGAAQKHFNVGAAKEVDFAFPEQGEQRAIVSQMKTMRGYSMRLRDRCRAKIDEFQGLRQALLRQAFAGELT